MPRQDAKRTPLHVAVKRYLEVVEGLKKPNTVRKYRAVLRRFLEFFSGKTTAQSITVDDLNEFMVFLKREKGLGNNSVIHNMIIVAQFLKKQGRPGLTREIDLPQKVTSLPKEYSDGELSGFFAVCDAWEASIYPGYHATASFGQVIVGTLYGLVDGFVAGLIVGWLYNLFAARGPVQVA